MLQKLFALLKTLPQWPEAYKQGSKDFLHGKGVEECQYKEGTEERMQWLAGWENERDMRVW